MTTATKTAIEEYQHICRLKGWCWGVNSGGKGMPLANDHPRMLTELCRERFGGDRRAINRHSVRYYLVESGLILAMDRTTDGMPMFFSTTLRKVDFVGVVPSLRIEGQQCWGSGYSWIKALRILEKELEVTVVSASKFFTTWEFSKADLDMLSEGGFPVPA